MCSSDLEVFGNDDTLVTGAFQLYTWGNPMLKNYFGRSGGFGEAKQTIASGCGTRKPFGARGVEIMDLAWNTLWEAD